MDFVLFVIACSFLSWLLVNELLTSPAQREIEKRLDSIQIEHAVEDISFDKLRREKKKRKSVDFSFIKTSQQFDDKLEFAGISISASEFVVVWILTGVAVPVILTLMGKSTLFCLVAMFVGLAAPPIVVKVMTEKRMALFSVQLGEALALMSNSMKSGYTLQQSMASVAKDMQDPIATEFKRVLREINYGVEQEDALMHMKNRINNEDVAIFASAVAISQKVGGSLADIFETISTTINQRIEIKGEIRVLSAQGRMSGIIIGSLPVLLFIVMTFVNPDYVDPLVSTTQGQLMLVCSAVMEVIGFSIMRKITDIEY